MNTGRTIFAQMMELLPRRAFDLAVQRYRGDNKVTELSCMDQLLCMAFAQITGWASLRETVSCLEALGTRRYHCGIHSRPARSTLANANESRDWRIFMDTAMSLISRARLDLPVDADIRRLNVSAYALDSTTIDLCLKLFPWAHFRRRKAGIKAHTMIDLRVGIPVFMRTTPAKVADVNILDHLVFEAGAFYVMDRGYVDFARFTGDLYGQAVEFKGLVGDAKFVEDNLVRAKGIGFYRITADREEVFMNLLDDIRAGFAEDFRAVFQPGVILRHIQGERVDTSSHGPIKDEDALGKGVEKKAAHYFHVMPETEQHL